MGEPVFDPTRGDQRLGSAREALQAGDPRGARQALDDCDGIDAELVAEALASGEEMREPLDAWRRTDPGDPDAWLLNAVHRLESLPWRFADNVTTDRDPLPDEHASCYRAVDQLLKAIDLGSQFATVWLAWATGLLAYRGFCPESDFEEIARSAEEIRPDSPRLLRARIRLLDPADATQPALAFSRAAAAKLPDGHPGRAEVITAHIERYLHILGSDKEAAIAYWHHDSVELELQTIAGWLTSETESRHSVDVDNLLAFTLARTRRPRLARPHFKRLGNTFVAWPWTVLTRPALAFNELRQRAQKLQLGR